jgi:hypothetical protein
MLHGGTYFYRTGRLRSSLRKAFSPQERLSIKKMALSSRFVVVADAR